MQKRPIKKVLVANRGEIAIRVFRACYDMGLGTIAIYSKEDKFSLFRTKADESYLVGESKSPLGAYLDIKEIIEIAKRKGADAIHPGYGFLSENADFARACENAGLIFIGPPADVLDRMGDKIKAKDVAISCGVPIIPGVSHPLSGPEEAAKLAEEFGYPVILKAAAGGGGRGMRRVDSPEEIEAAFSLVKLEAKKSFANDDIFIEKYLDNPKHIEVQILADEHGNCVHLYERDCSVQRRYQKVVEFTPAFGVSEELRKRMRADAVKISKAVGYANAGTVEFLVNGDNYYFIEMNPRIQVEHTITEVVTGIDLVKAQIAVAQGKKLSDPEIGISEQSEVVTRGFAIQCRVTTEDPSNNFTPDTGRITTYRSGGGYGVRLDAGNAFTGAEISPYYDSLLVKITTTDRTFEGAVRKAVRSIGEIRIRGVKTNISFLNNIITNPVFLAGGCHTKFIDETPELFDIKAPKDRATKVLKYIGDKIISAPESYEKPVFDNPRTPKYDTPCSEGLKNILDAGGPAALVDFVKKQDKLLITDTTLRDAHQSLLATRMRSRDMIAPAHAISHIMKDAFSLEMWGGATFDVAYRYLHESPWERLDELRRRIPNIPFQMLLRGSNAVGYTNYPDNLIKEFIKEAAKSGIDIFRVFDAFNWLPAMLPSLYEAAAAGKVAQAAICYSGDLLDDKNDKYTLKYYLELAKQLENAGAHMLAIKDMAGLLKPYAAQKLVRALKEEIALPIQLHTHDTSGNQIAALLLASEAGVDIVDTAVGPLAGGTSQPSLGSLAAALENTARDTGFAGDAITPLTDYWNDVIPCYSEFYADISAPAPEIYKYEMPGGQYTNYKSQVESLGLGNRFDQVKDMYARVNVMLGNIIKVTPSSKMVGDLAIFMVQNDLDEQSILEKGKRLAFPDSVITYFRGHMGQPAGGFSPELREVVLKGEPFITGRASELMPPVDFDKVKETIKEFYPKAGIRECISSCFYPKVVEKFLKYREEYGDITRMASHVFFMGMGKNETTELTIEDDKTLMIKYIGPGEANYDGTRDLQFELNGARRDVPVPDPTLVPVESDMRPADPGDRSHVGSAIPGIVSAVNVKPGDLVAENQVLFILEAMKMETSITAPCAGRVSEVFVQPGRSVKAGELLAKLDI